MAANDAEPSAVKAVRLPECPTCHRLIGTTERHRRFCPVCGHERALSSDPRVRHTPAEGERRIKHGDSG